MRHHRLAYHRRRGDKASSRRRYSVYLLYWYLLYWYLLYWYKNTNIDTCGAVTTQAVGEGSHFTCFAGTKVQVLTPEELQSMSPSSRENALLRGKRTEPTEREVTTGRANGTTRRRPRNRKTRSRQQRLIAGAHKAWRQLSAKRCVH